MANLENLRRGISNADHVPGLDLNRESCVRWSAAAFWGIVIGTIGTAFFEPTRWIAESASGCALAFLAGSLAYFLSLAAPMSLANRLLYANAMAVFAGAIFALSGQDSVPRPTNAQVCEAGVYVYVRVMLGMSIGTWLAWFFVHPSRNVKPRPESTGS